MPPARLPSADSLVSALALAPHPEGGFFRETHRDALVLDSLDRDRFRGPRAASTAIYYLLRRGDFSSLHRIASDEVWHHYLGATLTIHVIDSNGAHRAYRLGTDFENGAVPQIVVPAGAWFGARIETDEPFVLVGCTVAPGFDFADFEMGSRPTLIASHPEHRGIITELTRA